uniref:Uncharacterized protein n=1 Tax=Nelumbo nucifera TaxID=4432 RepID=A0A822Z1U6_NELNU|nr:TPA_asm: hypothetical protein HUJ06_007617 [Nelumbo nucifera]
MIVHLTEEVKRKLWEINALERSTSKRRTAKRRIAVL